MKLRRTKKPQGPSSGVSPRVRLPLADLIDEVTASIGARPGRLVLTAVGTVIGIAALVATLGLTATTGNHIVTRFDELAATQVTIEPVTSGNQAEQTPNVLPWEAQPRLEKLNGVVSAGTMTEIDIKDQTVRSVELNDPLAGGITKPNVFAASPGLLGAARCTMTTGRWFDQGHSDRNDNVAVIGSVLADQLNINRIGPNPAVFIGDQAFSVIGIINEARRAPKLLDAVIIPDGIARTLFGIVHPQQILVDTEIAAAKLIARQAPLALAPMAPEKLTARVPPEPAEVRSKVAGDVQGLLFLLGGLSLIVGGVGIANTTLVSVMERRGEIALRRSLGAQRGQIATQFLLESSAIGLLGGLVGASLGILITVLVAALKMWTPVLQPWLPLAGIGFGAVIGLLAGSYPSIRASRLEPISVLRGEV